MEDNVLTKDSYFQKCSFCKVFEATDKAPSGYRVHSHDYTQIWYVTRGHCEHYVENQAYRLIVGDAFLIPPNIKHKTVLGPESAVICCEFALESVLAPNDLEGEVHNALNLISMMIFLRDSKNRCPRFLFQQETGRQVEQIMRDLLREYRECFPYFQDLLRVKIQELLLLFMREFQTSPSYGAANATYEKYKNEMAKTIRYIDEHYCEPLTLEDVCRISALSRTYFCYLFKLITKQTFTEYLTGLRIRESMKLMEDRACSIAEISERLGFGNTTYFSKIFKKQTGTSPRDYRRDHSKG